MPTFYKDYQPMDPLSAWYLNAFRRLCSQETIALSEIATYIELFKVHRPIGEFVDCIQALDAEIKKTHLEKNK